MGIFQQMEMYGHEQVIYCQHKATGLKSMIAIHDTTAGPALGGCRMRNYENEEDMLSDVLRLSRGMTYQCTLADVDNGGGECVIWGDPNTDKTNEMFRALGRFVGGLGGRFYSGADVGTYPDDLVHAKRETAYIVGVPLEYGGSGDASVSTAVGVLQGIRATAMQLWGSTQLRGKVFAVQGLGEVGTKLAQILADEGAKLVVADVQPDRTEKVLDLVPEVALVSVDSIGDVQCDMFIPCAEGGILNDVTIPRLRCKAVVGSANHQLLDEAKHGAMLKELGILYAPDYLVNAGGLIQVADEPHGPNANRVLSKTTAIYNILLEVYRVAEQRNIPTSLAANQMVEERLQQIADLKTIRTTT